MYARNKIYHIVVENNIYVTLNFYNINDVTQDVSLGWDESVLIIS